MHTLEIMLKHFCAMLLLVSTICSAQSAPAFEVASVRASHADSEDGYWSVPNTGSFSAHNLSLERLIMLAYGIDANQIDNKPAWLGIDRFDISAKPETGIALDREQLKPRLRALLQERFHLATHLETRPVSGYALVVAKTGSRLQPTKGSPFPDYRLSVNDKQLHGLNWSTAFLAAQLQHPAGRPVVDRTGLSGRYDVAIDFSPDASAEDSQPSLFAALQQTLGLKLEAQKVPVEVLIIDHVDRTPAEN